MNKISLHQAVIVLTLLLALAVAPLFRGPEVNILTTVLILLMTAFTCVLLSCYRNLRLPYNGLAGALLLYWGWLGLSIGWSPVPTDSLYMFVWLSIFPLSFYTYSLKQTDIWPFLACGTLGIVLVIACIGIVQHLVFGEPPSSLFATRNTNAAMLNLIVLPVSSYFLLAHRQRQTKLIALLAVSLFILFFAISQTGGRGGLLTLAMGLGLIVALSWKCTRKSGLVQLLALWIIAFTLANLQTDNMVINQLGTLTQLEEAASPRLIIWKSAWELIKNAPWIGTGLSTFYLLVTAVRSPGDLSAGYFVHNDYLQIWLETGVIGLGLLLAIMVASVWLFILLLRKAELSSTQRFEAIGLFAGLFAVAVHSFVDFHFYIIAILITMGIMMARLQELAGQFKPDLVKQVAPAQWMTGNGFRLVVCSLPLFVLIYIVPVSVAEHFRLKAVDHYARGQLQQAEQALAWALKWHPQDSKSLNQRAELYREALSLIKGTASMAERRALLDKAFSTLDKSAELNPLRGIAAEVRGHLYVENADIAGNDWRTKAIIAYQRALQLTPRLYQARTAYAKVLWEQGEHKAAIALLDDGLRYWYGNRPGIDQFYQLSMKLNHQQGNFEKVKAIQTKLFSLPQYQTMSPNNIPLES